MTVKLPLNKKAGMVAATVVTVMLAGSVATVSADRHIGGTDRHHGEHENDQGDNDDNGQGYSKDQCKDGGWRNFKNPDGSPMFKNQGQCVSFFAKQGHHHHGEGGDD